jgi:hypothetical protein
MVLSWLMWILSSVALDDYETVFTGKSTADFTNMAVYQALVGNFAEARFPEELEPPEIGGRIPGIMSITKEVSFTFVHPSRRCRCFQQSLGWGRQTHFQHGNRVREGGIPKREVRAPDHREHPSTRKETTHV